MQSFLMSLFALMIGAAFCFAGYLYFLVLLPIWGFFTGFALGASIEVDLAGSRFLSEATSWIAGIALGIGFAALSYLFFSVAIVILSASVGYEIGTGLLARSGLAPDALFVVIGALVGVALVIMAILLSEREEFIILLAALGGASVLLLGIALLFGQIPLANLRFGIVGAYTRASWLWLAMWLAIASVGFVVQWRSMRQHSTDAQPYPF